MSKKLLLAALGGLVSVCAAQAQSLSIAPDHARGAVLGRWSEPTRFARIIGERMGRTLGQTIVGSRIRRVAAGSIAVLGVWRVRRRPATTLSIGHWSTHVINGAIYPLTYDLLKDLDPVALLPANPQIIVAKKDVPAIISKSSSTG